MKALPNFFLAGCQKTGSTWIHQCFREHPEIYVPQDDAIHYFTINYYKGLSWYQQYYQEQLNETMIGDTTPSYIRDPFVPRRIFNYCADAKIIITLRNPIDRAFSHYWHEKKKKKIAFDFSEVIRNYDLYQNWIVPGFYYEHLQKFYEWFSERQILVVFYEDLASNPQSFIQDIFSFLGVDNEMVPSIVEGRVNQAWKYPRESPSTKPHREKIRKKISPYLPELAKKTIKSLILTNPSLPQDSMSEYYDLGMNSRLREQLKYIYSTENEKLSRLTGRDLSGWQ